ncbi:MAG: sulfite exporter TauE/SafE family protein [Nitrosopumilaceae archaeon]|nr:sulfite exporter TauE/SafE family protein [Nitrosopumilaceae archaeon]
MQVELALEPLLIFLSIFSGIAVGFSLGLIGGGGSVLAVPLLLYVVGVRDIHAAIGTSALAVGAIAAINLIGNKRKKHVKAKQGIIFALPGLGGTFVGAQLGMLTPSDSLLIFFAGFMAAVAGLILNKKETIHRVQTSAHQSTILLSKKNLPLSGFFVGTLAGYFGIGGGFLIVPTMMYSGGLSIFEAIGTSLISVSAFGFTTAMSYIVAGNVDIILAALFVVGGALGGFAGIKMIDKIPKAMLRKIFACILFVIAGYIFVNQIFSL